MNTPRTSVSFLAMSSIVALAFGVLPQAAAAAPKPSDAPAVESKPQSAGAPEPPANATPRPNAKRPLDATATRALRSSSREDDSGPRGERVAMRTAPAGADGDPPKRLKSKKKATKRGEDARAPASETDLKADRPADRRISLDEDFLVEGKLEKPNAFFILRRSQSGYDWARLDAKFLPLVLESVQDPLF